MNMKQDRNYGQEHLEQMERNTVRLMLLGSGLMLFGAAGLTATNDIDYLFVMILGLLGLAIAIVNRE